MQIEISKKRASKKMGWKVVFNRSVLFYRTKREAVRSAIDLVTGTPFRAFVVPGDEIGGCGDFR